MYELAMDLLLQLTKLIGRNAVTVWKQSVVVNVVGMTFDLKDTRSILPRQGDLGSSYWLFSWEFSSQSIQAVTYRNAPSCCKFHRDLPTCSTDRLLGSSLCDSTRK